MKIDYFCFSVPTLGMTDFSVKRDDNENTRWCKTMDMGLMMDAKKHDMCIVYDRSTKKFYQEEEEIDIKGKVLFPHCHINYEKELLLAIVEKGGISVENIQSQEKIEQWPKLIQPIYRKVHVTTYGEFFNHAEDYKKVFEKIFFKTAKKSQICWPLKSYGNIMVKGKFMFYSKPLIMGLKQDDVIFLSECFESIADLENNMDCMEYRVFVLNHQLLSISQSYVDYPTEVKDEVKKFALEQIERGALIEGFPSSYVLDIGKMKINGKEVIDVIEYNPLCSSGLEVNNHLVDDLKKINDKPKQLVK